MLTYLHARLKKAARWLPVVLLPFAAQAQLNYFGQPANTAGTYTDLGTGGRAIATANTDDANSAAQNIGFTFHYNGQDFTQFILNTNGLIKLGATPPSTATLFYENFDNGAGVDPLGSGAGAADINLIMPFNLDLKQGTGTAEYRVQTTGTGTNQVCTIQWKNVSDKAEPTGGAPSQYANFSFQAKLYQSGNIEFVYGPATASANAAANRFPNVGLKGSSTDNNEVALALKETAASAWSTTTFISQNYRLHSHDINKVSLPDAGRTYRFVPGEHCGELTNPSINATDTSIQITFGPGAATATYEVTYTNGGPAQTVTPVSTTSPITITGLQPGTVYFITLQSVCATGYKGSLFTGAARTTGTPPAAPYAALPYSESFEGPWVNGLSTRDLPTANWRNSPAIGNASWRRDDDGASAGWQDLGADTDPAYSVYNTHSSLGNHSARFHTFGSASRSQGALDLYVNLGGAGNKTLSFDYINPTGDDSLRVFLSTNGGASFGARPVLSLGRSAVFGPQTVSLASTSATSVVRFLAKSDFGLDDLGIDNLQLRVVTATRNEALAATVGLYPNPAQRRFTLSVPAGRLHAATATLVNALGQTVQTRQLALPAAGGTADFDVSRLAAGVYSLQLKTADVLVVKRVVVE